MDDMQRFVDNDLTYAEQENLKAHIMQCPDCAASFEQLQRLSAELSLLPMVTPPFSIVDSIMPKLAELDAQQAAKQVVYLPTAKPRNKTILPWKIGGGLVAAAVIFGLIINMQPSNKFDAAEIIQAGAASQKTTSVADTAKSTKETITPEAPAAASVDDQSKIEVKFDESVNGALNGDLKKAPQASTNSKELAGDAAADRILNSPTDKKVVPTTLPPQAPKVGDFNYTLSSDKEVPKATPAVSPTPMPSAIPVPELAPAPQNTTLASDDGNFIGMIERQIVLVQTPDGNRIYTSSVQWNATDTIALVQWQESQRLIYEVRTEDGQVKRFIVDPTLKTEQEQKVE
ncbi:anti-sigma factor [Paenibacillus psychroresistens]|nr:zf-HC2 domain-containing protein [Paenibacillus psychroresistens]